MTTPSFHDLKKQASFFFKEKIKTARLALTDVTSAELLTEEAINGNPDAKTLSSISRAAFEVDDYWRIVAILHKRFNWGISVRKRSERILNLLDKRSLLKNERDKARKLTREILGFGSFSLRSKSQGILEHSSSPIARYGKCNSNFNSLDNLDQEHQVLSDQNAANPQRNQDASVVDSQKIEMLETRENVEENLVRNKEELHRWDDGMDKVNLLLSCKREELKNEISADDNHPFIDDEPETNISLLST
ncbi:uncharacterized protein LOC120082738 isoform X2 [Benincasa hispida]|uniref:uncharacterized protein LOC120082738 isoform X2 n=1 Tax=Benincasa hispida TaxID=102211 RepID=UPI001901DD2B|nr:uncharacterized protein LOC120082738 isoform X2 [Benincasa hispida]